MIPSAHVLRLARIALGWTQQQLAERADIGVATVVRAEAGRNPQSDTLEAIAAALRSAGIKFLPEEDDSGEGLKLPKVRRAPSARRGGRASRNRGA